MDVANLAPLLPVNTPMSTSSPGSVAEKLRGLVSEHAAWLQVNCSRQAENYAAFARDWEEGLRARAPGADLDEQGPPVEMDAEQRRFESVVGGADYIRVLVFYLHVGV